MRIQTTAVWEILMFLLNAVLFLLVGLQLPTVLDNISGHTTGELVLWGVLVSVVVIGVRLAWQFTVVYLIRAVDRRQVQRDAALDRGPAPRGRMGRHARSGVARGGAGASHSRPTPEPRSRSGTC